MAVSLLVEKEIVRGFGWAGRLTALGALRRGARRWALGAGRGALATRWRLLNS